jgi:hypothetical protein
MKSILIFGAICSVLLLAAGFLGAAAGLIDTAFGLYSGLLGVAGMAYFSNLIDQQ